MIRTFLVLLLLAVTGVCQPMPDAPKPFIAKKPAKFSPFFDKETRWELAASSLAIGMDGYTTRTATARGWHEINPLARPFANSNGGVAFLCAASLTGETGAMYLVRNHPVLKRLIPITVTAVEVGFVVHNKVRHEVQR